MQWMIYGANGYTGDLIAREAIARGHRPILAGRNRDEIEKLARELGLESRVFDLAQPDLSGVALVIHCAGPFIHTSKPMVRACLDAGVHYVDITGEIAVFEAIHRRNDEAVQRGVTLLPGAGFDVVPSDCLAAMLHAKLPDANDLWLAFHNARGGISPGTLKTMIEGLGLGGAIRRDGKIVVVPMLFDVREIDFSIGKRLAMTIPWGDVSTAFYTTGIPNIRVYKSISPRSLRQLKRITPFLRLARFPPIRKLLLWQAGRRAGPGERAREEARVHLWGRAANGKGEQVSMTMTVAEGYTFTARSAVRAAEEILANPRAGAFTPAKLLGSDFVTKIEGTTLP